MGALDFVAQLHEVQVAWRPILCDWHLKGGQSHGTESLNLWSLTRMLVVSYRIGLNYKTHLISVGKVRKFVDVGLVSGVLE